MDLETALHVKEQIAAVLGVDGVRRRARKTRVAIGVAPTPSGLQVAIRARTKADLDRAFGKGAETKVRALAGSALDIQITGTIAALPTSERVPPGPLRIGASIGHYRTTAGTLGFFGRKADGTVGIVSNNHVIAQCDRGREGDAILHPGALDGGVRPRDVIARLSRPYPRIHDNRPVVDAAFAHLRDDRLDYDPVTIGDGIRLNDTIAPLHLQSEVFKIGRTTGFTRGRITAYALQNIDIDYAIGTMFFDRQIEIRCDDGPPFAKGGDSGSLIVNGDGNPIALLFAASRDGWAYANPIEDVLHDLKVAIVT